MKILLSEIWKFLVRDFFEKRIGKASSRVSFASIDSMENKIEYSLVTTLKKNESKVNLKLPIPNR